MTLTGAPNVISEPKIDDATVPEKPKLTPEQAAEKFNVKGHKPSDQPETEIHTVTPRFVNSLSGDSLGVKESEEAFKDLRFEIEEMKNNITKSVSTLSSFGVDVTDLGLPAESLKKEDYKKVQEKIREKFSEYQNKGVSEIKEDQSVSALIKDLKDAQYKQQTNAAKNGVDAFKISDQNKNPLKRMFNSMNGNSKKFDMQNTLNRETESKREALVDAIFDLAQKKNLRSSLGVDGGVVPGPKRSNFNFAAVESLLGYKI